MNTNYFTNLDFFAHKCLVKSTVHGGTCVTQNKKEIWKALGTELNLYSPPSQDMALIKFGFYQINTTVEL